MPLRRRHFDHERLIVYREAIRFLAMSSELADGIRANHRNMADQLIRAATSTCLNIAEGAGEYSRAEKRRFYRIAKRSATECAAILDASRVLRVVSDGLAAAGLQRLLGIVSMLTALARGKDDEPRNKGNGKGMGKGKLP